MDEMKINALQCTPTDIINKLLNVGWQRNKRLGAMSSFAKKFNIF